MRPCPLSSFWFDSGYAGQAWWRHLTVRHTCIPGEPHHQCTGGAYIRFPVSKEITMPIACTLEEIIAWPHLDTQDICNLFSYINKLFKKEPNTCPEQRLDVSEACILSEVRLRFSNRLTFFCTLQNVNKVFWFRHWRVCVCDLCVSGFLFNWMDCTFYKYWFMCIY